MKSSFYLQEISKKQQVERYKVAQENYLKLIDAFPQSKFLHEAERIYSNVQEALKEKQTKDTVSTNP